MFEAFLKDLKHSLRMFGQSPAFTLAAVAALTLGIGANTAMVIVQGIRLALVGVVIGVAASFGLAQLISTFLFGVTARDPFVFTGVPALLTLVAVLAVWLPARRASHVDPIVALRTE